MLSTDKQTDKETDRQTNQSYQNITSFAKEVKGGLRLRLAMITYKW